MKQAAVFAVCGLALVGGVLVSMYGALTIVGILTLVVASAAVRWPFAGFLALVVSIGLENLVVVEGLGRAATGTRLLAFAVITGWGLGKLVRREAFAPVLLSTLMMSAVLLFAFALASTLWAAYPGPARSGAIQLAQYMALGVVALDMARSWQRVDLVLKAVVIGATAAALLTIEQAVFGGARRAGDNIAGGINATAILLVTVLPFAFYLLRSPSGLLWRLLGVAYIAIGVSATIVTYSRMNLLVLPLILTILTLHTLAGRRGRAPLLAAAAAAVIVAAVAAPLDRLEARLGTVGPYLRGTVGTASIGVLEHSDRGYHLKLGLAIAGDKPLVGAGFRNYGHLFRDEYQFSVAGSGKVYHSVRSPHSSHIGMLANLGVIGFTIWLALQLGAGLIPAMRAWGASAKDGEGTSHLASQALTYALGLQVFIYGWYTNTDLDKLFWILLGLAGVCWTLARPDPRPIESNLLSGSHTGTQMIRQP